MNRRGVSPVVGVVLMVVLTLLLASMVTVSFVNFSDFNDEESEVDDLLNGSDSSYDSEQALTLLKDSGEEPRTSGDDILEFRIENSRNEQVTIVSIEIDATGIDTGVSIDDGNAEEVEIRRIDQTGKANRADDFAADGTRYDLVNDSNGQKAVIGKDVDDAEVDIRRFSKDTGTLEIVDSEENADLNVNLVLSDDSKAEFFFKQQ